VLKYAIYVLKLIYLSLQYGVLLFIVLCLEVGIGIWAFVTYDSVSCWPLKRCVSDPFPKHSEIMPVLRTLRSVKFRTWLHDMPLIFTVHKFLLQTFHWTTITGCGQWRN